MKNKKKSKKVQQFVAQVEKMATDGGPRRKVRAARVACRTSGALWAGGRSAGGIQVSSLVVSHLPRPNSASCAPSCLFAAAGNT